MGYWQNLYGAIVGKNSSFNEWLNDGAYPSEHNEFPVTQSSSMRSTTVMGCVAILSEDVAKLPVHVYKRRPDGGKVIQTGHPVERLLQRPNDYQTRFEFIEFMMAALLLRGNAYAPIVRDGRGRPTALIPLNPDRVAVFESPSGDVFYAVSRRGPHDMAVLKSLPLMVHSEDMLHVRWLSMQNSLVGESRISLARAAISLALSQQELAARLSANNTNLGGVLQTDQRLSADAMDRLARDWKERKQGARNAGEIAVLQQGLKWQQLGMTAQDAEFIASRNFQVPDICRIFRVPPYKLGVMDRAIGTSLEQLDQDYMNNTVSSYLTRFESKIEMTFDLAADEFVEFDVKSFLRASMQTRYNAYRTGIVGMFLTPNEARREEGLPDHPEGDTLYQPTNVAPIGFDPQTKPTSGPGSDVTGHEAPGGRGDPAALDDSASE